MNAKNPISRKDYVDKNGKSHSGYGAKAARKRDGNHSSWSRFAYGSRQGPGSMKK